jgi:peptidyl-prolyl cis-trans isomerase C
MTMLLALALAVAQGPEVVAQVGAETLTRPDLQRRMAQSRSRGEQLTAEQLLDGLVEDVLLAGEGRRLGLDRDPDVVAAVDGERRRAASERLLERDVNPAVRIEEPYLRQIFHDQSDKVRLKLLILMSRQAAQAALERLRAGGAFEAEAPASLDSRSKQQGGDTGKLAPAQLDPALATVAFGAAPGELFGPLQLSLGWAVGKVVERTVATEQQFQAGREELRQMAEGRARIEMKAHLLQNLRGKYKVKLDEGFFEKLGSRVEPTPEEAAHVIASVNGRPVRYRDVLPGVRDMAGNRGGGHFSGPRVKMEVAWSEVDKALLAEDALARGLGTDPVVVARVRDAELAALSIATARRIQAAQPPVPLEEVAAFYQRNAGRYPMAARRTCSHILAADRKQAEALRARLGRGERFEDVARQASADASAAQGGDVGAFTDERVDALAREGATELAGAVRTLKPGEVSQPLHSAAGWHLVRCGPRLAAGPATFEEVSESIRGQLASERGMAAVRRRLTELRGATTVAFDRDAARRLAEHP